MSNQYSGKILALWLTATATLTSAAIAHGDDKTTAQPAKEKITTFAGIAESNPSWLSALRPEVAFYQRTWKDYQTRAAALPQQMQECRQDPVNCPPAFAAWVRFTDAMKAIDAPDIVKLTNINTWINNRVTQDKAKSTISNVLFHSEQWLQTPYETFAERNSKGVCGDFAVLKYETAKYAGIAVSSMRLIGGLKPQPGEKGFHTTLMAHVENGNYIMEEPAMMKTDQGDQVTPSYLIEDYNFTRGWHNPEADRSSSKPSSVFIPITSFNAEGFHVYGNMGTITISAIKKIITSPLPYPAELVSTSLLIAQTSLTKATQSRPMAEKKQLLFQLVQAMSITPIEPPHATERSPSQTQENHQHPKPPTQQPDAPLHFPETPSAPAMPHPDRNARPEHP